MMLVLLFTVYAIMEIKFTLYTVISVMCFVNDFVICSVSDESGSLVVSEIGDRPLTQDMLNTKVRNLLSLEI